MRAASAPAPCFGLTDLFYSADKGDQAAAVALCRGCDVAVACLTQALLRQEPDGVWGAFSAAKRALVVTELRQSVAADEEALAQLKQPETTDRNDASTSYDI